MRIHHLALRTADLPRLERFYADALGLVATRRSERSVWLAAGDALVMLEQRAAGEPSVASGSMELVAFAVEPAGWSAARRRLAGAGVAIEGATDFTIYFRDPEGRRVALSSYPSPAPAAD